MTLTVKMEPRVDEFACPGCGTPFRRVYGAIYDDGKPAGVYSLDLHRGPERRYSFLAMGAPDERGRPTGVVCRVWTEGDNWQVGFVDPPDDPWFRDNFGNVLDRAQALKHPLKERFFHFSDHIVESDMRIRQHFTERDA